MQIAHVSSLLIWTISLASILCMLVRPRRIAEAYWACGGAILLILTRLIALPQAMHAVYEGWDVYLFLTGMMILAEVAREEEVFGWVADVAAQHARNSPARLFVLIYLVGTVVTALLSNDATAVVLTPAVLAVVRRAKVDPKPYLLACAFIANAASFIFPISNPANLVVFDQHMPPLVLWLRIFLLPSIASIVATFLCLRWLSRKQLSGEMCGEAERALLSTEGKLALVGLAIASVALISSSALGLPLGAPTCVAALFASAVVTWRNRSIPLRVAKGVSWSVLPLVAGLFVIVEALQNAGLGTASACEDGWMVCERSGGVCGGAAFERNEQSARCVDERRRHSSCAGDEHRGARHADWSGPRSQSFRDRLTRDDSVADCAAARKGGDHRLGILQNWCDRHARCADRQLVAFVELTAVERAAQMHLS
jgi:arsenical pump membrane protein